MVTITHKTGDIFASEMPAIGHGVNTRGMMGAGIAAIIAKKYPEVLPPYQVACQEEVLEPGSMLPVQMDDGLWILNLASQRNPGADARYEWLGESVSAALSFATVQGLRGIALPRIGAGIGGLEWERVVEEIESAADDPSFGDIEIELWSLPDA